MSLETATYVNQLVISNPDGADPKGQGDDHLRLIKTTLKNTFPNLNAVVNTTPAELNSLVGGNAVFKTGMIIIWSGSIATIPAGWVLCNGTAGTPDLRNRFIVGAGATYAVGVAGGSATHNHTIVVGDTALTVAQLPPHVHNAPPGATGFLTTGNGGSGFDEVGVHGSALNTGATGSGAAHGHSGSSSVVNHLPPYLALAYIMKS